MGELMLQANPLSLPLCIETIILQIHISYKTSDTMSSLESHNASCLHF